MKVDLYLLNSIMPESFIVIGKIRFIPKQDASPGFAATCIREGATVLLVEDYGVIVVGESAMQVKLCYSVYGLGV